MSVEQVKAFFTKVKEDSTLAQKLKDAQDAYTGDTSDKTAAVSAVIIPVAAQAGFNFTAEDFKAAFEPEGEASSDELNAVAGGRDFCYSEVMKSFQCGDPSFVFKFCDAITAL